MAYDRYDSRSDGRRDRGADDRERERGHGRGGERGFFERAGDEISSWFGDESSGGRDDRHRDQRSAQDRGRERGDWYSSETDRDRYDRDDHRRHEPMARSSGDGRQRWGGDGRDYRPMTGDYGRGRAFEGDREQGRDRSDDRPQSKWEQDEYRRTSFAGSSARSNHDDTGYHEARRRHIDEFDRDYDDYHRERQSSFENDFGGWREQRQSKRGLLGEIREHMEVVGNDDEHVGTVDRVAGDRIILTKSDPDAGGAHHSLTCTSIDRIDGERVILDCSAEQAKKVWRDDSRERALFEREDQGSAGPHILDRSFSGTYR